MSFDASAVCSNQEVEKPHYDAEANLIEDGGNKPQPTQNKGFGIYSRSFSKYGNPLDIQLKVRELGDNRGISKATEQKIQDVYNRTAAWMNENGHKIYKNNDTSYMWLNFTTLKIRYQTEGGEIKHLRVSDLYKEQDPELMNLAQEINIIAKGLGIRTTGHPEVPSNRSLIGSTPLAIPTSKWEKEHYGISYDDYAKKHHPAVDAFLKNNAPKFAEKALKKAKKADTFLNEFLRQLKGRKEHIQEKLGKLEPGQKEELKKLRSLLDQLDAYIVRFEKVDKQAVFRSVSFANDDLRGLSAKDQTQRADLSKKEMLQHLVDKKDRFWERVQIWQKTPEHSDLEAYSQDKGDLLVHDHGLYDARVEGRGEGKKVWCPEEFIIYNILNLNDEEKEKDITEEAIDSMGIPLNDKDLRKTLEGALTMSRKQTRSNDNE